jgi:S1-C subfamily serine protease
MKTGLKILLTILILLNYFFIGSFVYDSIKNMDNTNINIGNLQQEIGKIKNNIKNLTNEIDDTENLISDLMKDKTIDVNKMLKSSVTVLGLNGMGSGTIIKKTKSYMLILSCYHVVADIVESEEAEKNYFIAYTNIKEIGNDRYDLGSRIYEAELLKYNKKEDIILLKVEVNDDNLFAMKISDRCPKIGDTIYTVGNPLGKERTLSKGIMSNVIDGFYITDGTITFGNSGGSLINDKGELIGIPARVSGYSALVSVIPESGLGESITLNRIREFLIDTEVAI